MYRASSGRQVSQVQTMRMLHSIRVDKVVSREEMRDGGELGTVSLRVVVELEERYC